MTGVTMTDLANHLGVSKGRISQLVSEGRLAGCFTGDGRARRFNLDLVAEALNKKLDPGQMLGNGRQTKRRIKEIQGGDDAGSKVTPPRDATPLDRQDPDHYQMIRSQEVAEKVRRLRRENEAADGTLVLASAVGREASRQIAQEIAEFESVMREAARQVADQFGVDYRGVRKVLVDAWRDHRGARARKLSQDAADADLSQDEKDADF